MTNATITIIMMTNATITIIMTNATITIIMMTNETITIIIMTNTTIRLESADGARPQPPLLNFEASKNLSFVRSNQVIY